MKNFTALWDLKFSLCHKKIFNGKIIAQTDPKGLQTNVAALYIYSQDFTIGLFKIHL
jgi:hypothetical protein